MHIHFSRGIENWASKKMGHCPCFGGKKKGRLSKDEDKGDLLSRTSGVNSKQMMDSSASKDDSHANSNTMTFSYRELATATNNFRRESFIGEGGFGAVYKGQLTTTGQVVAVKQLNHSGLQGDKEFLVEILMLSLLRHPNLVSMIGYCAEGEQRLLVYEFMPLGSLEHHLHDVKSDMKPLDWNTRMRIAAGAARGLNFLHNEANPPVIYRDLKSSNILLGEGFVPKLSDFGLAKFGPEGDKSHISTRIMGTHGYCAPEYADTGKLTTRSDIYSFGVVLLELITGQKALDKNRGRGNDLLLDWARPMLRDRRTFVNLADPKLNGHFSVPSLCRAVGVALMCLQTEHMTRPSMIDVVGALDYLASQQYVPSAADVGRERSPREGGLPQTKDSLPEAELLIKDQDRERAIEEAKKWGKSCRAKKLHRTVDDDDDDDDDRRSSPGA